MQVVKFRRVWRNNQIGDVVQLASGIAEALRDRGHVEFVDDAPETMALAGAPENAMRRRGRPKRHA